MDISGAALHASRPLAPGRQISPAEVKARLAEDRMAIKHGLHAATAAAGAAERELLRWIVKADRSELWRAEGARSTVQFISAELQISNWKARRWIEAAHGLEFLPHLSAALESGSISLDKVVELSRFATPDTELKLIMWARRVSTARVRERADQERVTDLKEVANDHDARYLHHYRDGDNVHIDAHLPADDGAIVVRAIDELARTLPDHPDAPPEDDLDDEPLSMDQRRADALVMLVSGAHDAEGPPSATADALVVVHVPASALVTDGDGGCHLEDGTAVHPETARRMTCDGRTQMVFEGKDGTAVGVGRISRDPPRWLRRLVLKRDGHRCTFTGCENRQHLKIHHVVHWSRGGRTDLDNLLTVCHYHHKLVHEHRWSVTLDGDRTTWFRPGGRIYEPGVPLRKVADVKKDPPRFAEAVGYSRMFRLTDLV